MPKLYTVRPCCQTGNCSYVAWPDEVAGQATSGMMPTFHRINMELTGVGFAGVCWLLIRYFIFKSTFLPRTLGVMMAILLMAGSKDQYVPLSMLPDQLMALTAAHSVTARVFTEAESAQNHCQIGNMGLALKVILGWLDEDAGRVAHRTARPKTIAAVSADRAFYECSKRSHAL